MSSRKKQVERRDPESVPPPPENRRGYSFSEAPLPEFVLPPKVEGGSKRDIEKVTKLPEEAPPRTFAQDLNQFAAQRIQAVVAELAQRRIEGLKLYEPLPFGGEFHRSLASERIVVGSNRSGKTLCAAVEVARCVCNADPAGKWPTSGIFYCVGKDLKHVAQVMWPKLSRAGAFRMIRDKKTGLWRAYRPWDPGDKSREKEAKWAPPLIPPRLIKEIAWENKKLGVPELVRLRTGWELPFFSSEGKPPQGSAIHGAWFDEEIVDESWYSEIAARLIDHEGRFIWSATPQVGSEDLWRLSERAHQQKICERPRVQEFVGLQAENPHVSATARAEFEEKLEGRSEEEKRARLFGEFPNSSYRVYPEFSMDRHGAPWREIPKNWTRYMVVDPGRQVCAVLFAAVPPPEEEDAIYLYDELYLRACDADKFGEAVKHKSDGVEYQAFIIDKRMGRQTEAGSGRTVEDQYSAALRRRGVSSVATGFGFAWPSDNVDAGILAVRSLLRVREDGTPKLRILREKLPNFLEEIKRYRYRREKTVITDKPDQVNNHLMDCLRYLAISSPRWVSPRGPKKPEGYARKHLKLKEERRRHRDRGSSIRLGSER